MGQTMEIVRKLGVLVAIGGLGHAGWMLFGDVAPLLEGAQWRDFARNMQAIAFALCALGALVGLQAFAQKRTSKPGALFVLLAFGLTVLGGKAVTMSMMVVGAGGILVFLIGGVQDMVSVPAPRSLQQR